MRWRWRDALCSRRRTLKRGRTSVVVLALAAIAAGNAAAQPTQLYEPTLTDPQNPQSFNPPGVSRFGPPPEPVSRAPTPPIPPAAGDTGFDSTGALGKKKKKRKPGEPYPVPPPRKLPPPMLNGPPQKVVIPQFAARTTYANAYKPSDAPPRPPRPARPFEEPFDPVGFKVGAFLLKPSIEIHRGLDTNPRRTPGGSKSQFTQVHPELLAKSEWTRHEMTATLRGSYLSYDSASDLNRPSADLRVNGRIDVQRDTKVLLEARYLIGTDYPGSPNLTAGLAKLPVYTTHGATVGLTQNFNRLELTAKGMFDRNVYRDSDLTDGTSVSNETRNYIQYGAQLRAGYEITPGVKPFVQVDADKRVHDIASSPQRDSRAITPRAGATFEITRILTGEVSIGYIMRHYEDPALADLRGLVVDGSLVWVASGLTTLSLTAKTYADESILPGVSGALRRDVGLQVDHAFRRWLVGTFKAGVGFDNYVGLDRADTRTSIAAALTYKFSREFWLKGEIRQDWLRSNVSGNDNSATTMLLGVKLQR